MGGRHYRWPNTKEPTCTSLPPNQIAPLGKHCLVTSCNFKANGSSGGKLIPATKCVLMVVLFQLQLQRTYFHIIPLWHDFDYLSVRLCTKWSKQDCRLHMFARCFQSPFIQRGIPRYILRKCDTAFCDQIGLACSPEVPPTFSNKHRRQESSKWFILNLNVVYISVYAM